MFKYKEGKAMIINMFCLFVLMCVGVYCAKNWNVDVFYNVACLIAMALTCVIATMQIVLAVKLFAIAKQLAEVDSKTDDIDKEDT